MSAKESRPEVGAELEAHCRKCKLDTVHVITAVEGDKIKKVMCKTCMSYHAYKAPAKSTSPKTAATPRKRRRGRKDWTTLMAEIDDNGLPEYRISEDYTTSPGIRHPKFGVGVITNVTDNKLEVVFQDGTRQLVHKWKTEF